MGKGRYPSQALIVVADVSQWFPNFGISQSSPEFSGGLLKYKMLSSPPRISKSASLGRIDEFASLNPHPQFAFHSPHFRGAGVGKDQGVGEVDPCPS